MTQTIKQCSCCGHDHDAESWGSLEYLGIWDLDDGEGIATRKVTGAFNKGRSK